MLEELYKADKIDEKTIVSLYKCSPFRQHQKWQYPGNIIKHGFLELSKIVKPRNVSVKNWLQYKTELFNKLCSLITVSGTRTFDAVECALSLHRIAIILTADLNNSKIGSFQPQTLALLSRLHEELKYADTQAIANGLWAVAKLIASGKLETINPKHVNALIEAIVNQRDEADIQDLANSLWAVAKMVEAGKLETINQKHVNALIEAIAHLRDEANTQHLANSLWAVAKIVEAGKLETINPKQVNALIEAIAHLRDEANTQHLANSLWAVAKMVEAGKLETINPKHLNPLIEALVNQRDEASAQHLTNSLWAVGLINTITPVEITVASQLAKKALSLSVKENSEKRQIITGVALLGLEHLNSEKYSEWIKSCRPVSKLKKKDIEPFLERGCTVEKEAFISGFFVDLLVVLPDGRRKIIEFDGPHHNFSKQLAFDKFRDGILTARGYDIFRVKSCERNRPFSDRFIFFKTPPVPKTLESEWPIDAPVFIPRARGA
ncbi:protein of unknown function [Legionella pneumophila subsp. pneumophila]|uniref:hypothetical protein n=1 Tax=Legionella pneumophila TaxID=446 RepID=UPI00026DA47E|nr:hypothetical protein [Legionella pneumophila]CCD09355.1 protein of unknown function [Legionella pneumophila subsp. pneumophila]